MAHLVRSAALSYFVEVASSVGLDPYRMIARFGLPPACLFDPEIRVPVLSVGRLLEASAQQSGVIDFGLRLAERRSLTNLGVLALLVREQPSIRHALDALVRYMHLHSEALLLRLHARDDQVILTLAIDPGGPVSVRQGVELGIGFLHRSLERLLGAKWKPLAICFVHAPPARLQFHRRFFGARIEFNHDFNGIICAARDVDATIPATDAKLASHVQKYLDTLSTTANSAMRTTIREYIVMSLASGTCSVEHAALRLGVDRRTIHRHLAKEGTTFSSLLDTVRDELLEGHLNNRRRPLAATAELLGFSALSAFSRWFKQRHGCSVSEWRKRQQEFPIDRAVAGRSGGSTY
jgi:AraC-like DNA-binding protein